MSHRRYDVVMKSSGLIVSCLFVGVILFSGCQSQEISRTELDRYSFNTGQYHYAGPRQEGQSFFGQKQPVNNHDGLGNTLKNSWYKTLNLLHLN